MNFKDVAKLTVDAWNSDAWPEDPAKDIEKLLIWVREDAIRECAKIAKFSDHCDLPGHRCTHEISDKILSLLEQKP